MKSGDEENDLPAFPPVPETHATPLFLKDNSIAIYTLLIILMRIKNTMGLEAMLEYSEHYQRLIERYNPEFKVAVKTARAMMNVEKMYRDRTYEHQ